MSSAIGSPLSAPIVDSLAVRVVVDSRHEAVLPKETHDHVRIEHVGDIPDRIMQTLAAEWGLSLHLSSEAGGERAEYLLDFGWTPEILIRNLDLLGIDLAQLNALILSHGHLDHFGGLVGFLDHHRGCMRDDLALYVGGEDTFLPRWAENTNPDNPVFMPWGELRKDTLISHRVIPTCCATPHVLDGPVTTGFIPRDSFEKSTSHTFISNPTVENCPDHFTPEERAGKLIADDHPEEHAVAYLVRDRGLVVISSCGHIGIVNTVRAALAATGVDRLHAVLGGFHLVASKQDYVVHTVDALAKLNPDVIIPMHCTGQAFIDTMRRRLPEKLVVGNLGSRYTFGT
jgi:7,8-dihydropterin-6-yl-methyl-4-(beta-D-ribofuranosyl)aminobenzene 5'-phosphate synthase